MAAYAAGGSARTGTGPALTPLADEPLAAEAEALASGDDVAIAEAFSVSTAVPWATGGEHRVRRLVEDVVVPATGTVDAATFADLDTTHEITWADAFPGPDLAWRSTAPGSTTPRWPR